MKKKFVSCTAGGRSMVTRVAAFFLFFFYGKILNFFFFWGGGGIEISKKKSPHPAHLLPSGRSTRNIHFFRGGLRAGRQRRGQDWVQTVPGDEEGMKGEGCKDEGVRQLSQAEPRYGAPTCKNIFLHFQRI